MEGIYRNGKVELLEPLAEAEGSRVIVTCFHPAEPMSRLTFAIEVSANTRQPTYAGALPHSQRIGIARRWPLTMICRRGDVVLVLFPDSNLRTAKRRPALVVQADSPPTEVPQTIVAMITGNMDRAGHASRVVVCVANRTSSHPAC